MIEDLLPLLEKGDIIIDGGNSYYVDTERRKLISAGRDIHRNFSLAAWMLRKHLDYVSSFTFQCRSGNPQPMLKQLASP
jgi:hypothetical protein